MIIPEKVFNLLSAVASLERQLYDAREQAAYWKGRCATFDNSLDQEAELRAENRELRQQLLESKAQHKATTAHFEWLQVMFNRESAERALISQAKLGVALPPLTVGTLAEPDATRPASMSFEPSPPVAEDEETLGRLEAEVGASMFEDQGDDKAQEFGARHEPDGSLAYDR
jgi:hypothetical protein